MELLSALLTPVIALVATYIAVQQYRLQRLTSRRELYERRLGIFEATRKFIAEVVQYGRPTDENIREFNRQTARSIFLFGNDVTRYLDEIYKKGVDLMFVDREMERIGPGAERDRVVDKRSSLFTWFSDQLSHGEDKFKRYLSIS